MLNINRGTKITYPVSEKSNSVIPPIQIVASPIKVATAALALRMNEVVAF
ncbi:MAG: hypothetical protein R3220_02720 [Balneolaceae bacterium]|nr:hypothetical protein [Balneolaceae bacterium]